jgi:cysteinyl-tRNA synthetase
MLTLGKEPFVPQDPNRVTVYVCGPTVYAPPHLGNLRSAVNFDVLHRVLLRLYPEVVFVRNYTDIDDKIIKVAADLGRPISEVTKSSIDEYITNLKKLNVLPATKSPRVTHSMDEIRRFIHRLIDNGSAYASQGHVLFDRTKNPTFYLNTNLDPSSLNEGDAADYKRHPHDFVLWKPSTDDQPGWDSPWGFGRPGWHIECSAMIREHLGETIDIHGGGADLKFPHHENECAQSHALHGKPLANYWVHNGMLSMDGKMSKSRGNVWYLGDVQHLVSVRYFLLTAHYRQPLECSKLRLEAADSSFRKITRALKVVGTKQPDDSYLGPLLDDLNTPRAIAELHALAAAINSDKATNSEVSAFRSLTDALGLLEKNAHIYDFVNTSRVNELQEERMLARLARDFTKADALRIELLKLGVDVNDAPLGKKDG